MGVKKFLLDDRNVERDSYIWNMAGSLIMAFQSVIMLMILTRTLGLVESGIFTIAYANANLFLTIGKYGMRYFQVSDVNDQFSFAEYRLSRAMTSVMMVIVSIAYTLYSAVSNDYTAEKTQVIIWMCLFKTIDAIEDIYHGLYQRQNRLDIASRAMTLRLVISTVVFGAALILLRDLLTAVILATVISGAAFILFTKLTLGEFVTDPGKADIKKTCSLLKVCFPLFAGSFLSFYIGNAPKYAIDSMLTDELQACYGFIAMPVFVIGLLNNFIFNPMLYHMSVLWNEGKIRQFVLKTLRQTGIVALITIVCIVGAYLLGVPVLSWLYNTDLAPYKNELLILLLGGGFLGLSGLLNAVITIIRYQKSLMWGYAIVAVIALLFSNKVVAAYGMMGAAVLYTMLMGILCIIFALLFVLGIYKGRKQTRDDKSTLSDV